MRGLLLGDEKLRNRLFSLGVAGFAFSSLLLVLGAPWLLLRTGFLAAGLGLHISCGLLLLVGSLYRPDPPPPWSWWSLRVAGMTYAAGFAVLAWKGDQQIPFYGAWLVLLFSFALVVVGADWARASRGLVIGFPTWSIPWLLLALTLALRTPFYLLPPRLSTDLNAYAYYAQRMSDGAVPYRDVFVPYTPGFTLLLQLVGALHLAGSLRALLVIPDLLITLVLASGPGEKTDNLRRAFAWALLPLPAIDVAWSAHLDGLVALLILVGSLRLRRKPALGGLVTGLALTIRPVALAVIPSALMTTRPPRSRAIYLGALLGAALAVVVVYLGQLTQVIDNSVTYQFTRGGVSSLRTFITWYASGGGWGSTSNLSSPLPDFGLGLGLALYPIAALVVLNLMLLRRRLVATALKWYGVAISSLIVAWGAALVAFPGSFPGGVPVAPAWPYYRPSLFYFAFGAIIAVVGLLLAREWWSTPPEEDPSTRLMFLNLFSLVLIVTSFYSWYLLWSAPVLVFLLPRRAAVLGLVGCLAIAPTAYYAGDFNRFGATRVAQSIEPSSFSLVSIFGPPSGSIPVGRYMPDGARGMIYLSSEGNLTVGTSVQIDPLRAPILTFTITADRDSLGWNKETISFWVEGTNQSGFKGVGYSILWQYNVLLSTGLPFYVNLLYAGLTEITAIAVRFENHDTAPHQIWISQVSSFAEYS